MKQFTRKALAQFLLCTMLVSVLFAIPISINAGANVDLAYIEINGYGIYGFDGTKTNYIIDLPYHYTANNYDNFTMPIVKAIPDDLTANVNVVYPSVIDGGNIIITVTSADDLNSKVYRLTLRVIGKNLYTDGGMESGTVGDWVVGEGGMATVSSEQKLAGNSSLRISYTTSNSYACQIFPVSTDKRYIATWAIKQETGEDKLYYALEYNGWNKPACEKTWKWYDTNGVASSITSRTNIGNGWSKSYFLFNMDKAAFSNAETVPARFTHYTFAAGTNFWLDEAYLGELVVADIELIADTSVTIPKQKEADKVLPFSILLANQFGNKAGLESEEVSLRIVGDYPGVRIEKNNIIVTNNANAGSLVLEAECIPSYAGAIQKGIVRRYEIKLQSHDDKLPYAKNVSISGVVKAGETLNTSYQYYQVDGLEEKDSEIQWFYSEQSVTGFKPIENANDLTLVMNEEYENYYICAQITPKTITGVKGTTVTTKVLRKPTAPSAFDVSIIGQRAIGNTLTGIYSYSDTNDDVETDTTFRWLIADSENGEYHPITDATEQTYVIKQSETNKFIRFEVTPRTTVEPMVGDSIASSALLCATQPVVDNVGIKKLSDTTLTAEYEYSHPNNIAEGKTICNWYEDGKLIHTGSIYEVSPGTKKTIKLEVIPVAAQAPFEGEAKSLTIKVGDDTKKSIRGGGSGGGGGGSSAKIVPLPTPTPEPVPEQTEDVNKYWASDAISFVLEADIMQNPKPDDFCNDEAVTRAEFIYYVVKTLELEQETYEYEFNDVFASDWYANALQAAVNKGIISKADNFDPNRQVTRDEICKILVEGLSDSIISDEMMESGLDIFKDREQIAQWAIEYVEKAVFVGLMRGVSGDEFLPKGNVTRAQTAVLMKRIAEYPEKVGLQQ